MSANLPDRAALYVLITPTPKGRWFFHVMGSEGFTDATLLALTRVTPYGWARTKERAQEKARKRLAKIRERLANLSQPSSVIR